MIFDRHSEYREWYSLCYWVGEDYFETVDNVNEEILKKYIEEQYEKNQPEGDP